MDTPLSETITSFGDVMRLLETHPDWRADLRRVLLTDDLLDLPRSVSQLTRDVQALVEAQRRTETRLSTLTENVQALVEAQRRTETQLSTLTEDVRALAEAQRRTNTQLATLTEIVQRQSVDIGRLKGDGLEVRYLLRGVPSVTRLVRRPHALSPTERDILLDDAEAKGLLTVEESDDIELVDLIVRGRHRGVGTTVYVVTEVSWGVGVDDVYRAAKRAALLAKTGVLAIPAVAGEWATPDAQQLAPGLGVWQFMPSQVIPPTEA